MRSGCIRFVLSFMAVFLGCHVSLTATMELLTLNIPIVEKAPMLDGNIDDTAWAQAVTIEHLYQHNSDLPAPETKLWLLRDNAWLYIAAHCRNPRMEHVTQVAHQDGGDVYRDDSLEFFIRPTAGETDSYYHFVLNFAGVRAEQRCARNGVRDRAWTAPWRAATQRQADGWTAEVAIPLYALGADDLSAMTMNISRNFIDVILDAHGANDGETRLFHALRPDNRGGFHNFNNFLAVGGLAGVKPEVPFAPEIVAATLGGISQRDGENFYELDLVLKTATPVAGSAQLTILEDFGQGEQEALALPVQLRGELDLKLDIPAGDLSLREIRVILSDPSDGNLLANFKVRDTAALNIIRKVFVGRSYYTSEDQVDIRLELGLPEQMLSRLQLEIDVGGKSLVRLDDLESVMTPALPVAALAMGDNPVQIRIMLDGRELAAEILNVVRLEPRPGYETKADFIRGVILKDQQPYFPVGISGAGLLQRRLDFDGTDDEEYIFKYLAEDIGLDTIVRGSRKHVAKFMDLAEKYGLNVITWSYPDVFAPMNRIPGHLKQEQLELEDLALPEKLLQTVREDPQVWSGVFGSLPLSDRLLVRRALYEKLEPGIIAETEILSDYKNFVGYWNIDEPNLINPDDRIAAAEWYWKTTTTVDPYRPRFLLYASHIPHGDNWTRWADILAYDIYPKLFRSDAGIRIEPGLSTAYFAWQLRERCRQDNKIMWFVPIANNQGPTRTPVGMDKSRMLCQAYTAIIYGARGLLYFALHCVVGEDAWDALRTISAQVKDMTPALVNGDVPQIVKYTPDNLKPYEQKFPMVNAAVFKYPDGDYLLMAANIMPHAVDTEFKVAGVQSVVRLFEDVELSRKGAKAQRGMELKGEMFSEKIEPYGVRAYRMQLDRSPAYAADSAVAARSELGRRAGGDRGSDRDQRSRLQNGDRIPVEVALDMTAVPEEQARMVDVEGIVRQLMVSKNYIPNPCFERQFIKGVPDFFKPFYCLSLDHRASQPGSTWHVDYDVLWEGKPSLRMFRPTFDQGGPKVRGTFGAYYPPVSIRSQQLTFSFYVRASAPDASLTVRLGAERSADPKMMVHEKFELSTEWQRHSVTFDLAPIRGDNLGARRFLASPSEDVSVWISGLQMEQGDAPTEFRDDSVLVKKK